MVRLLARKLRRDLARNRAQFVAVAITIFVGVALFGGSYDAFQNLKASYDSLYDRLQFADLFITGGPVPRIAREMRGDPAVTAVETRLKVDLPVRVDGSHKLQATVITMPDENQPAVNGVMILEGGYLDEEDPDLALVEQHMAGHFHLAPGDRLEILGVGGWRPVTVAGVVASAEYLWPARNRQDVFPVFDDFGVLFISRSLGSALTGGTPANDIGVRVNDEAAVDALAERARAAWADEVFTRAEQPSNEALSLDIQGFGQLSLTFPILFLTAAGIGAYILLKRMVDSQRTVIGTLAANGFRRRTLLLHYLAYGIVAGLGGAVPGAVVGVLAARAITGVYTDAISVPVTVSPIHPVTPLVGILFGLATGALAALAPALAASRVSPAEAMRGVPMPGRGGVSIVERLAPPLRRLPAGGKLVLRGIGRNRRRSLYTIAGIILALTLILASWGMVDTVNVLLGRQFDEIQQQDATIYLRGEADAAALGRLDAVEGVAAVEPVAELGVTLSSGDRRYVTSLLAFDRGTQMHRFRQTSGKYRALPARGLLAGRSLRGLLDVRVGDTVTVSVQETGASFTEAIAGFVDEPLGTYAYMSLARLDEALADAGSAVSAANAAMVAYEAGTDRAVMRERLTGLAETAVFVDGRAMFDLIRSFMGLFYTFTGVMLLFGGLLAFALIFNIMSVNLAERTVEIATLMASGVSRGTIFRLVTYENLAVSALGVAPGLVIGYFVASLYMASYSTDLFKFDLHMQTATLALSAIAVLGVALLAQWPGLRALGRVDIATVVRERAL